MTILEASEEEKSMSPENTNISAGVSLINIPDMNSGEFGYYLNIYWGKNYKTTNFIYGMDINYTNSQDKYTNISSEFKMGYNFNTEYNIPIVTNIGVGYAYTELGSDNSNGFQYSIDNSWRYSEKYSFGYKLQANQIEIDTNKYNIYSNIIYFSANY
jgi:hypothetical protein